MSYSFYSRGIGLEIGPCFVCKKSDPKALQTNICVVVNSLERSQILDLFEGWARAHASREHQIIICSCRRHRPSLDYLNTLSEISKEEVQKAYLIQPRTENF